MITFLTNWSKNIFLIIIFSTFLEIVFPNGNSRKYIKFVISLIILFVIINPLLELKKIDYTNMIYDSFWEADSTNTITSFSQSDEFVNNQYTQIIEIYKNKLCNNVKKIITTNYPNTNINNIRINIDESINSKNFGEINAITIYINNSYNNQHNNINENIIKTISKEYDIPQDKIKLISTNNNSS